MSLLKHVVQSDPDTQARQAAVTVIKQLFKGLDRDTVQVSTSSHHHVDTLYKTRQALLCE